MYLSFKALHIIAVISWMAGILYLYRLFIYHTENQGDSSRTQLLSVMENRLYKYITVPAMLVSWFAALCMLSLNPALFKLGWFHAKLLLVIILTATTLYAWKIKQQLQQANFRHTSRQLRFLNEVPTLLMIVIVLLVVFRPF